MERNFREVLRIRGIDYRDHGSDRNEIRLCCPFCGEDRFRLGVNIRTGKANCFNCPFKSRDAVNVLIRELSLGPVIWGRVEPEKKKYPVLKFPSGSFLLGKHRTESRWTMSAVGYLVERGWTIEDIVRKKVLFTEVGKYSHRVIFPAFRKKKLVGLVARAIVNSQKPRYLNSGGAKVIWNLPEDPGDTVLLCEGVFKAVALEKSGIKIPVGALLGHTITDLQISELKGVKIVLVWPDPDPVGIRGALKVASRLEAMFGVALPQRIPLKQADEMEMKEITATVQSMKRISGAMRCWYRFQAAKREREK